MMELLPDFRDLLVCLDDAGAEFAIIGGYAVAFHGHVRATKDLDILVRPTPDNARKVYRGLAAFGAPMTAYFRSVFHLYGSMSSTGLRCLSMRLSRMVRPSASTGGEFGLLAVTRLCEPNWWRDVHKT